MEKSNMELFETLQSMYVPGENQRVDSLVEMCRRGVQKKPDDLIVRELISTAIQSIVNVRDRRELNEYVANLDPEEREIVQELNAMTDDDLRVLAERNPQLREPIAILIFCNAEKRRAEEEIKEITEKLRRMTE